MEKEKMDPSQQQHGEEQPTTPGDGARDRLKGSEGPAKPHGDALQDGSGTRHGVVEADERPES